MVSEIARVIVYFDGDCVLCHAAVDFIIRHDPQQQIYFASLQSARGQALLARLGMAREPLDSMVLQEGAEYALRSTAALRIAARLQGPVRYCAWLQCVPLWIRDPLYAWVARHRYRWFGRAQHCRLPSARERARFID